jgi:hypothetical protein
VKNRTAVFVLICLTSAFATQPSFAISVEVAKNCTALAQKAFPPRVTGNPAAGYAGGTAIDYRNYFNKCVTNGGKMDDQSSKPEDQKNSATPGQAGNPNGQPTPK